MGIKINNYIGQNSNITVLDSIGCYTVVQYDFDKSVMPNEAQTQYYMSQMGVTRKQLVINLNGNSVKLSAGAMQMMAGSIDMVTGVKGVGDLIGKAFKSKMSGDSAIKPVYTGHGTLFTEPTYKHIILESLSNWNGAIVCDDGMFLSCDATVEDTIQMRSNVSSAVAGGEGLFNLMLKGNGNVVFQSRCPREELMEIILDNDVVKIDGNMAVCWSGSLNFTVERAGASLIGSAASGEGLVNVYRGTGRVLVATV